MQTWKRTGRGSHSRLGAAGAALAFALLGMPSAAGAAVDRLPDIRMASLKDFHIQTSDGRRLLRFGTIIVNLGDGPLEIYGHRACSSQTICPKMNIQQRIYNSAGGSRLVARPGHMKYAGDGHNHWHVQQMEHYELFRKGSSGPPRRGAKVGYCFFDNVAYRLSLPRAPNSPQYGGAGCGVITSTSAHVGLSVGWGDLYPWNFVFQWIDITGLAPGGYRVCVTADPYDHFIETVEDNNQVWQDITLTSGGGLSIGAKGWSPCQPGTSAAVQDDPEIQPLSGTAPGSAVCRVPTGDSTAGMATTTATETGRGTEPDCRAASTGRDAWLAPEAPTPVGLAPAGRASPPLIDPRRGSASRLADPRFSCTV